MIAKSNNYENATKAAGERIARLETLKEKKECKDTSDEIATAKASLAEELKTLKKMHDSGDLTKAEYRAAKNKLLGN